MGAMLALDLYPSKGKSECIIPISTVQFLLSVALSSEWQLTPSPSDLGR